MDSTSCLPRQVGARPAAPQRQRMLVHCRAHQHAGALPRARRLAQQQRTALEVSGCVCARGRAAPAHSAGRGRPSQYPACQRARDRLRRAAETMYFCLIKLLSKARTILKPRERPFRARVKCSSINSNLYLLPTLILHTLHPYPMIPIPTNMHNV